MNIVEEAFKGLYPKKKFDRAGVIKYSGKFKAYNANVKITAYSLTFNLSRQWKGVSREIVIGLLQELLVKVYKKSGKTVNIDIYNNFIKNLHKVAPVTKREPLLLDSFSRVNAKYFYGMVDAPNLLWGGESRRKLGCYEYQTDTITISKLFLGAPMELLDYIMYHEVLHKKVQFYKTGVKTMHHTAEFRRRENDFKDADKMENEVNKWIAKDKVKNIKKGFWRLFRG